MAATAAPPMPQIDQCWIENTGRSPYTIRWAGVPYVIPPGERVLVPRPCVNLWLGDPDLLTSDSSESGLWDRNKERARVRTKWGVFVGAPVTGRGPTGAPSEADQFPNLHAYSFEGELLPTVIEDPDGDSISPEKQALAQQQNTAQAIETLSRQVQILQAQLQQEKAQSGIDFTDEASGPEAVPVPVIDPESGALDDSSAGPKAKPKSGPSGATSGRITGTTGTTNK